MEQTMYTRKKQLALTHTPQFISNFCDFGVMPYSISRQLRKDNSDSVIQRFFAGSIESNALQREAIARFVCPGPNYQQRLRDETDMCDGGFGPTLLPPTALVERAFREYGQTDLGAVTLSRLLAWDDQFIRLGWRKKNGTLSEKGIAAFGAGLWRPFRIASHGLHADTVTPSGVLLLPDNFIDDVYSTGDIAHRHAILHHELKAHVLPIKEGAGLQPGRAMQLICIRLESEALKEISLPERRLHWDKDGGIHNHTLNVDDELYYHGLARHTKDGKLMEVDPQSDAIIRPAVAKSNQYSSTHRILRIDMFNLSKCTFIVNQRV